MNKLLVLLIAFSLLLGVFGFVGVMAVDAGPQDLEVDVTSTSSIIISPSKVNFGSVIPGVPAPLDNAITFSAGADSNEDMDISVTGVTGVFFGNIDVALDGTGVFGPLELFTDTLECITGGVTPCTYTDIILDATLTLPPGTPAGTRIGTITYLVTGTSP